MQGNPKPVKAVWLVIVLYGCGKHAPGNGAVAGAHELYNEIADRALPLPHSTVPGKEMERHPDKLVIDFVEVPQVHDLMGRAYPLIMGVIAEPDAGGVGGVVDVLRAVSDYVGLSVIEPGKPRRDIGNSVVEIDLHLDSFFSA